MVLWSMTVHNQGSLPSRAAYFESIASSIGYIGIALAEASPCGRFGENVFRDEGTFQDTWKEGLNSGS
jgi:hypothetical protein